jgi:predicted AAA+ superfamily ATPase
MKTAGLLKKEFEQTAFTGFYPRIYDKKIPPSLFYSSYLQTYVQRDVLQLIKVTDTTAFMKFIRLLAGRVGQLVNLSTLASDIGIAVNTIKAWLAVLEASYILYLLKPHHENFAKRLVQQPKIYFYDTGLLCYLLGIENAKQVDTHFARGNIFENFVVIELLKNKLNTAQQPALFFWRDKHGKEVDCIIEARGKLYPVEIKSSHTKSIHFFDGLNYYKTLAKAKSKKSFVVYGGKEKVETKDGLMLPWNVMEELYKI